MFNMFKKEKTQVNMIEELEKNLAEIDRLGKELEDLNNVLLDKITVMNDEMARVMAKMTV